MIIRPFDWRDLPILLRYRQRGLYLDNASVLTRGSMLVPAGALLSYFAPATGIYTFLCMPDNAEPLMGQVNHAQPDQFARLTFIAPESAFESPGILALLDHLVSFVGRNGAIHLLAEVDERSAAFDMLRRSGFSLYVRQRIWQLNGARRLETGNLWRTSNVNDLIGVRSLYNTLVPALVQQVEPQPNERLRGLVFEQNQELLAYAEIKYGARGIWVQPFIHPDAEAEIAQLIDLLRDLPNRRSRPVYLCVRSYQSWLEHALEDVEAQAGPVQAVMVKHLAIAKRVTPSFALPALEGGHHEATAPFIRSEGER